VVSKRRERELARQRYQRRQQEVARRRARQRRRNAVVASVVAVLLVLGGAAYGISLLAGGDNKKAANLLASPSPTGTPGGCAYTPSRDAAAKKATPPSAANLDRTHNYTATMKTNTGTITFEMFGSKAPCTVNSFNTLAAQKYFDTTPCHRLTSGGLSVLQCGDPKGTGAGGPGYQFPDENLAGATYKAGTVAMANAGPGTNGSQFFLVYKDSQLPPSYTPFGRITGGMAVLQKIAAAGSTPTGDGKPKKPVIIQSFTVKAVA
jgi:peptidyl-prolyl cis-trans isomerase B (cyclophilin B)